MEFNREQIVKALEHCTSSTTSEACNGCPFYTTDICTEMENGLEIYALKLINELIEENETIKLEYEGFKAAVRQQIDSAQGRRDMRTY
ncbi:MAG: hypothetical protein ACI4I1_06665 [Oscillospiraceae bacterium]